jgi:hypothetical protein
MTLTWCSAAALSTSPICALHIFPLRHAEREDLLPELSIKNYKNYTAYMKAQAFSFLHAPGRWRGKMEKGDVDRQRDEAKDNFALQATPIPCVVSFRSCYWQSGMTLTWFWRNTLNTK